MRATINALCDESAWTAFQPLEKSWLGSALPDSPGLYRIRLVHEERSSLAYIGQSGKSLKERISSLRHVFVAAQMPYKAPHTAGPALWSWLHRWPNATLEVSVVALPAIPDALRLGLECLALALHRQRSRASPLCQFGRMPAGYAPSSGNDAKLARSGQRFRGGPTTQQLPCHLPGISPQGPLEGDPHERVWCGHHWTPWTSAGLRPVEEEGLYRLRLAGQFLFLGQGKLADRLKSMPSLEKIEYSWVASPHWLTHHRLELLTDLVAAHLLTQESVPRWQFHTKSKGKLLSHVS
jgi:hypothetical protein